ncbi:MAG: Ohr family peroxiredoxin, partial [Frankia sp.]|nr:Ohr family peroxiredoxin [Frankia sp.]
ADNDATNPEQLLAAGYAACFQNAMIRVARKMKLDPTGSTVTAKVGLGQISDISFGLDIELHASLPNVEREDAEKLLDVAHQVCPFSRAMEGNVDVRRIVA